MEKLLAGKPVSQAVYDRLATYDVKGITPAMSIILVGYDPASAFYVSSIVKQAGKHGIRADLLRFSEEISETEILKKIHELNLDPAVHGIMVQKPLPLHINESKINQAVNPAKDIDGINPLNLGMLFSDTDCLAPCTALAVTETIRYYGIPVEGKHVVILGRSKVVAKPLAGLLLQKNKNGNATVSICHSYTQNLKAITSSADILVAAIGKPEFVTGDMIKEEAVCLDVGINQIQTHDGVKYAGDIDFGSCYQKAVAITPVPGGIGSVTTALLLENLLKAVRIANADKNS